MTCSLLKLDSCDAGSTFKAHCLQVELYQNIVGLHTGLRVRAEAERRPEGSVLWHGLWCARWLAWRLSASRVASLLMQDIGNSLGGCYYSDSLTQTKYHNKYNKLRPQCKSYVLWRYYGYTFSIPVIVFWFRASWKFCFKLGGSASLSILGLEKVSRS